VTRAQLQRLQRDVLHGTTSKEDYLQLAWQEHDFGNHLSQTVHWDAEHFLGANNSP